MASNENKSIVIDDIKKIIRREVRVALAEERNKEATSNENPNDSPPKKSIYERYKDKKKFCAYCNKYITYFSYSTHLKTKKHSNNVKKSEES